jgi:hypothetical protein
MRAKKEQDIEEGVDLKELLSEAISICPLSMRVEK